MKKWTKEEDDLIKLLYPENRGKLKKSINKRWETIVNRAWILKVKALNSGKNNARYKGYGDISGVDFGKFKQSAENRSRKIPFLLNINYLNNIYKSQDKKCALSGEPIYCKYTNKNRNISLDRIDSNKGYEKGNVQFVSIDVNFLKNRMSNNELIKWAEIVTKFYKKGKSILKKPAKSTIVKIKDKHMHKGVGNFTLQRLRAIQSDAKKRNLSFNLSPKYLWDLFISQRGYCALSGVPIEFSSSSKDFRSKTASLDRIDNSKGYIKGNVRWIHKQLNIGKLKLSDERFYEICINIYKFNKNI